MSQGGDSFFSNPNLGGSAEAQANPFYQQYLSSLASGDYDVNPPIPAGSFQFPQYAPGGPQYRGSPGAQAQAPAPRQLGRQTQPGGGSPQAPNAGPAPAPAAAPAPTGANYGYGSALQAPQAPPAGSAPQRLTRTEGPQAPVYSQPAFSPTGALPAPAPPQSFVMNTPAINPLHAAIQRQAGGQGIGGRSLEEDWRRQYGGGAQP